MSLVSRKLPESCANMRLSFKLMVSFLLMVFIIGVVGTAGLLFIEKIQGKVAIVSEVASPMVMTTIRLGETMQGANIESMIALCSHDEKAIEKQNELLKNYD